MMDSQAETQTNIAANLERVRAEIAAAAHAVGRSPDSVKLVIVSKFHPAQAIRAAAQAGATRFGENYAEQAAPKIASLAGCPRLEWHMIGHVQSRKARLVAEHFQWIHSLDSLRLASRLSAALGERDKHLNALLEFNLAAEETKSGWKVRDEGDLDGLFPEIEAILALPGLRVRGLMTMPPLFQDPALSQPYFTTLARLRDRLASRYPEHPWNELSMGTSADFSMAIRAGATFVRIGTAILGPRPADYHPEEP